MFNRRFSSASLLVAFCVSLLLPVAASAQIDLDPGFNPDLILSDDDIFDVNGFPKDRMIRFLESKGKLATTQQPDIDGVMKLAPEIIWRVAQSYKINPKYLIALIQKEQSLVEDSSPSQRQLDWAAGYGVCDSCSKDDPAIQNFKGFAAQLEWAAKQHREKYLIQLLTKGTTIGGQGNGKAVTIDGMSVTPQNNATAMLYSYTPHLHGNLNLWRIWQRWFSVSFPDGTIVHAMPSNKTYLLRFGEKRPFASAAVVATIIDPKKSVEVQDTDLSAYPDGVSIKFPEYSLLRDPVGHIYLLAGGQKRNITNMEAFAKFGFNTDELEDASLADLASYPDGAKITIDTQFPQGTLMKTADSPGVWYVEDGMRYALVDGIMLKLYFRGRRVQTVTQTVLDGLTVAEPYKLHDGELVKATDEPTVYVVEAGALRPIPSADVFETIGWSWKNIVSVPARVLAIHVLAEPVDSVGTHEQLAASPL
ncbi:MAG: hypothetical protein ABIO72_06080 [Patescibacteria group bacterium]